VAGQQWRRLAALRAPPSERAGCCCWLLAAGCWLLAAGCWLLLMLLVVVSLDLQLAMLAAGAVAGWHWLLARQRARS
jgi:hypothetical protein